MDQMAFLPDIRPTGYPAILKTGYRLSGRTSGECRIPDILPDTGYSIPARCSTELLKKLKHLKSTNKSKNVLLISGF